MLLNNITVLSAYPTEFIQINMNNSAQPELNVRMGIRFRSNYWGDDENIVNFSNLTVNQAGAEPLIFNNPDYAAVNNMTEISKYVQPTNFVNIPSDFPVFVTTSAFPYHDLLLTFRAGASSITVFPSGPYPKITKTSPYSFSVSGTFMEATALDYNITKNNYKKIVDESTLTNLQSKGANITFDSSFKSAHKHNYVLYENNDNNSIGIVIDRSPMPAFTPYDTNIIYDSFCLTLPVSSSFTGITHKHYLCYHQINNGVVELSSLTTNDTVTSAILYDATGELSVVLASGYKLPKGHNIVVSYETSAYYPVSAVNTAPNTYSITATNISPYLLTYNFTTSSEGLPERNAFNINFAPSAIFLNSGTFSAISLSTVMVDNYLQTFYPIVTSDVVVKFEDRANVSTLSAIDALSRIAYLPNQWIPASANLLFVNDGFINIYSVSLTYSAANNSIWSYTLPDFYLNRDKLLLGLRFTRYDEFSVTVEAWSFPFTIPSTQLVKWSITPEENLSVVNSSGSAIPLNILTELGEGRILVDNLGVNSTVFSIEIPDYGTTYRAYNTWYPTSASFIGATIALSAAPINDFNELKTTSISALMRKRSKYYVCPYTGLISWSETLNKGETSFFDSNSGDIVYEGLVYPSIRQNNIVNTTFTTTNAFNNPANITFNIHALFIHPDSGSLQADLQFNAREYPAYKPLLFATLSSLSGVRLNSANTIGWNFTNNDEITAVAVLSAFFPVPLENIRWNLPNNTVVSGISAYFPLSADFCLSVSALSARPKGGGFEYYNFVDTICLYHTPNPIIFDYIGFPEKRYFPETILNTQNYTGTAGMTALSGCGSQNIVLSTFGGFEQYHYKIGSKTVLSDANIITIPVTFNDVSASNIISVSAFSPRYPNTMPVTIYNTASSDSSNIFRQPLTFVEIPDITPILSVDADLIDLDLLATTYFVPSMTIPNSGIPIVGGSYVYVLSSTRSTKVDTTVYDINDTSNLFQFTTNNSDFFSISAKTFNVFNLYLSGFLVKKPNEICPFTQEFFTNSVPLSVYNSNIDLNIFTQQNIHSTNETVWFSNETHNLLPIPPNYFMFDDGAGNVQTVYSTLSSLTGYYVSTGLYSPVMCAIYVDGTVSRIWKDFILIKNDFEEYDAIIDRQFPEALALPYDCSDFTISPNDWQTAAVLNDSFTKIQTNIEYLSAMSQTFNITFPKNYIGRWSITTQGQQQWFYDNEVLAINPAINLKHAALVNGNYLLINNDTLELRNNDFHLSLLNVFTHINEGEKFISPSRVVYNTTLNKIIVLDRSEKLIYVFSFDDNILRYTHYWGGAGERNSRTKLNDPIDLHIDSNDFIYVVDTESQNIKCYNNYLNWLFNIEYSGWNKLNTPISVTTSDEFIFILSSNHIVYVFKRNVYVSEFPVKAGNHIAYDYNHSGLLYVFSDNIHSYGENGTYINTFPQSENVVELLFLQNEILAITENTIFKFINYIDYFSILDTAQSDYMWSLSSIFVTFSEPVTDFVLNDSFKKLHDNMQLFSKDIRRKFIVYLDEYGNFIRQETRDMLSSERLLSASSFQPIGLNEIVSYDVLARTYNNICVDLTYLTEMIDAGYEQLPLSGICWTWKYHKIGASQQINNNVRPYSWIELRANDVFHPETTAITWQNAFACCGETNNMPICWIWGEMSCDCIFPRTWQQSECTPFVKETWAGKESNCCLAPDFYFENCTESC